MPSGIEMRTDLQPFSNESQALSIGDLQVENRQDRVIFSGSVDVTRDKVGLDHARRLKAVVDAILAALESHPGLAENVPPPISPTSARDPFA